MKEPCPGAGLYESGVLKRRSGVEGVNQVSFLACPACGRWFKTANHGMNNTIRPHKRKAPEKRVTHLEPGDVVMPGALGTEPQTVPLKDAPGGNVIGTATVNPDGSMRGKFADGEAFEGRAFVLGEVARGFTVVPLPSVDFAGLGPIDASGCVRLRIDGEDYPPGMLPKRDRRSSSDHPVQVVVLLPNGGSLTVGWYDPDQALRVHRDLQQAFTLWAVLKPPPSFS